MRKKLLLSILAAFSLGFAAQAQYCAPLFTSSCTSDDFINLFTTSGGATNITTNLSSGCNVSAGNYIYHSTATVSQVQGQSFSFSVQAGPAWGQGHRIWVDWNNDQDFDDPGEDMWNSVTTGTTLYTGSITIPLGASPGVKRMRVRCSYASVPTSPCASQSFGEAEDFNLLVLSLGPCQATPFVGLTTSTKSITCSGETFSLAVDTMTFGSGQHYQWQWSTDSITWTNKTNDTTIALTTSQTTTHFYRLRVICGVSTPVYSTPKKVTTTAVALPGGTYTINGGLATGGTNFNSFADFKQAIVCGGIAGPVVVNVINKGSDYAEQLSLGAIGGTSATNTITIRGNGQTITSAGGAQYGTILLNGAQYIKIKNLKIKGTGTTTNFGLHITGGASYIEIDSCEISVNPTSTSTLTVPVAISGSLTSATTSGISGTNISVKNSNISGGYYCVTLMGPASTTTTSSNIIENNYIHDFYVYGVYSTNQISSTIKGNNIDRKNRQGTITTFYGMYFNGVMNGVNVTGNRIHNPGDPNPTATFTSYPMYMSGANATLASPMLVTNNAIYEINSNGTTYGIYLASGDYINLYHNTVSVDNTLATGTSAQRAFFLGATTGTFDVRNNLFSMTNGNTGAKHVIYLSSIVPTFTINYNQYFLGSSGGSNNFIGYYTANVSTFANWQAVNSGAFDQNGVNGDPVMDTSGYVPQSAAGNNIGVNLLTLVPNDIFGAARTSTPDIGAAEFVPLACLQPYGIVGTAALTNVNLTWTNVAGADSVRIEYGPSGFVQGTGTALFVVGDSTLITGLSSQTCYDFYLTTYCGGAIGNGVALYTVCTPCGYQSMPYLQTFTTWAPQCFDFSTTGTWDWNHNAGGYAQALFWNFSSGVATMKTAQVSITTGAQVKFDWAHFYNTSYPGDRLVVRVHKINTTQWDTLFDLTGSAFNSPNSSNTAPPPSASDFIQHTSYLPPSYVGQVAEVEFIAITGFGPNLYVDNFEISQVPPCTPPIGLAIGTITASSGQASWSTINGTCFDIEYGPLGFIQGTGVGGTIVTNVTSPYTITNLAPNTFYDVYVRDCCNQNAWIGPVSFKTACLSQLSGTYTIGGAAGPTNFATLDSAINVLTGCGISNSVTFNLQGGTYSIGPKVFGSIVGASATKTVTFNGGGSGTDTISVSGGTNGLTFNGTSYVTFQNLTINASSTDRPVWLYNNANHITFSGCHILGNATSTSSLSCVIGAANSNTTLSSAGDNANDITVSNCKLVGGYYGFTAYGTGTTTYSSNFTLTNNEFVDQYYYGIRMFYISNITLEANSVKSFRNTFAYGYYGINNSGMSVKRNQFIAPTYGFYVSQFNSVNPPTATSEITNNFMGGGTYGLYLSPYAKVNIYHNSLRGGTSGFYAFTPGTDINIRNNIFVGGTSYAFYNSSNPTTGYTLNYNLYYATGANLAFNGAAFTSLTAWQAAQSTHNANSISGDPGFLSNTDFHIIGTLPNNLGVNGLATVDIDNDVRPASGSTVVDMGADEFTPLTWDASLEAFIVPLGGCGDSSIAMSVVVRNFGLNTITSLPISVAITGGITATVNTTASVNIPQGATVTVPAGTFNAYNGAAGVNFAATVSLVGDQNVNNNTKSVGPGAYIPYEPLTSGVVDTVCPNGGTVDLYATYIPGTRYAWYGSLTGGSKIANGDTLTVPANGPSTYYVAYDSATSTPQVGAGTLVSPSTNITPYKSFWMDGRSQYLILASEMASLGVVGGGEISSLAFDVVAASAQQLTDFTIKMGGTSVSAMTGAYQPTTGMTTVLTTNYTVSTGWNIHQFTTPFIWNGTDNILIEVCYDNTAYTTNSSVRYDVTSFQSVTDGYADLGTSSGCTPGGITNQIVSANRPNMQMNIKTIACSSIRKPVSFVVNTSSAVAAYNFTVQPNGADVSFNAGASTGNTFAWDFGDNTTGTGVSVQHTYAVGGAYNVCLVVTDNVCNSSDTICQTVLATVGIDEGLIGQTLNLYPNPNDGKFRVEFQVEGLKDVEIRMMSVLGKYHLRNEPRAMYQAHIAKILDLSSQAAGVICLTDNYRRGYGKP